MMTQIKHGISFLIGGLYISLWWLYFIAQDSNIKTIALLAIISATTLLSLLIVLFFVRNWKRH